MQGGLSVQSDPDAGGRGLPFEQHPVVLRAPGGEVEVGATHREEPLPWTVLATGLRSQGGCQLPERADDDRAEDLLAVGEVRVDGRRSDARPAGNGAQGQRIIAGAAFQPCAGGGQDLVPQPVALATPVPTADRLPLRVR